MSRGKFKGDITRRGRYLKFFGNKSMTIGKEQGEQILGMIDPGSFRGLISDLSFYRQYKSGLAKI